MAKSKLIKDLATNKISIEEILQRMLIITNDLNISEIKEWIISELNGYSDIETLPDYRKNVANIIMYSGINGALQMKNQPLSIHSFPEECRDTIRSPKIMESISTIEKTLENEDIVGIDLTSFAKIIYNFTGIKCYKIFQEYSLTTYSEIISNVKNKSLLMLLELEKEFGNLDDLDIEIDNITEDKVKNIKDNFSSIFYNGKREDYNE